MDEFLNRGIRRFPGKHVSTPSTDTPLSHSSPRTTPHQPPLKVLPKTRAAFSLFSLSLLVHTNFCDCEPQKPIPMSNVPCPRTIKGTLYQLCFKHPPSPSNPYKPPMKAHNTKPQTLYNTRLLLLRLLLLFRRRVGGLCLGLLRAWAAFFAGFRRQIDWPVQ